MIGAPPQREEAGAETARLVQALRQLLGEAGQALPSERALAARLGAKRHRIRTALDQLRREEGPAHGMAPPRGRGPRLSAESLVASTNAVEVIEVRLMIEPSLARLAAVRASPSEIRQIERAATTTPGTGYGAADLAFHRAVAAGARNALADQLYALLRKVGADARIRFGDGRPAAPNRQRERDQEHRRIAQAIAARDPESAAQAMQAHLEAVQQRVLRRLTPAANAA